MFKMPEPNGDSPEMIALCLFDLIRATDDHAARDKAGILSLYAECLTAVKGERSSGVDDAISRLSACD